MCIFRRWRCLCIHDQFTIGLEGRCKSYRGDEDSEDDNAKCLLFPNPSIYNVPLFWKWEKEDLFQFCDRPSCLEESAEAYYEDLAHAEDVYEKYGVEYYLTDPAHLKHESLRHYSHYIFQAYGGPTDRGEITDCPVVSICELRQTPYFMDFRSAWDDVTRLESLHFPADEIQMLRILEARRTTLDYIHKMLAQIQDAMRRLRAVRRRAKAEGHPRFSMQVNVDGAVSWVSSLPRSDLLRTQEGHSLWDCCMGVFGHTRMGRYLKPPATSDEDTDDSSVGDIAYEL